MKPALFTEEEGEDETPSSARWFVRYYVDGKDPMISTRRLPFGCYTEQGPGKQIAAAAWNDERVEVFTRPGAAKKLLARCEKEYPGEDFRVERHDTLR